MFSYYDKQQLQFTQIQIAYTCAVHLFVIMGSWWNGWNYQLQTHFILIVQHTAKMGRTPSPARKKNTFSQYMRQGYFWPTAKWWGSGNECLCSLYKVFTLFTAICRRPACFTLSLHHRWDKDFMLMCFMYVFRGWAFVLAMQLVMEGVRQNNCKTVFIAGRNRLKIYYCLLTLFLRWNNFFFVFCRRRRATHICQCGGVFVLYVEQA